MDDKALINEIELYPPEAFQTLLDHEVNRARRYGDPLTLLHLSFEIDPDNPQTRHSAEVFTINLLNLHLRDTDIPCKKDNEFLVLMPSTGEPGGRIACQRLEELFNIEPQTYDRISFKLVAFIGMVTVSGDRSLFGKKLMENAAEAMQHARTKQIKNTVVFSEIER